MRAYVSSFEDVFLLTMPWNDTRDWHYTLQKDKTIDMLSIRSAGRVSGSIPVRYSEFFFQSSWSFINLVLKKSKCQCHFELKQTKYFDQLSWEHKSDTQVLPESQN